ncbi:hypothetical protein WR25_23072 [Diploscapter pachys]|uniref:Uncharacterized protein n=1 Tax=Diploscapter pachys TaxID=2018661 RepID=A0A2A2M4S9_9BILA|nr:hypothetical protein WR25_23072 [Diploscapter pachys]
MHVEDMRDFAAGSALHRRIVGQFGQLAQKAGQRRIGPRALAGEATPNSTNTEMTFSGLLIVNVPVGGRKKKL